MLKYNLPNIIYIHYRMSTFGFIILRHVNSSITNTYWKKSYESIRRFYPENHILIIDDNSNIKFLDTHLLYKTTVINSEFPKRGELLPYYYYLHNKLFDYAIILHDSVFIQEKIDFKVDSYKFIWDFEHNWDQIDDETTMIKLFNDNTLYEFYKDKNLWKGCFGGMSIITHDYLTQVNNKYDISKLLNVVLTRHNRCSFERIIGCLLQKEATCKSVPLLGNIHKYCKWGIRIDEINEYKDLPLVKVWSGR